MEQALLETILQQIYQAQSAYEKYLRLNNRYDMFDDTIYQMTLSYNAIHKELEQVQQQHFVA